MERRLIGSHLPLLGGAAGDKVVPGDGDLAEDGQRVVGQQVQLGVPQLCVGHEPGNRKK